MTIGTYELNIIVVYDNDMDNKTYTACEYGLRIDDYEASIQDIELFEQSGCECIYEEVIFEGSTWKHEEYEHKYSGAIYSQLIKHSSSRIRITKVIKHITTVCA